MTEILRYRSRGALVWLVLLAGLFFFPATAAARREHQIHFKDTPYELNVYKIFGRKEGPTMMIIGGIQGNEPGGFLSADLYADLALKQGNLIVVPRANFYSILLFQRGPNGDMNRKFGIEAKGDYDSQIVRILKELMAESDILLNLHDGWGFYRPTYESKLANPLRYGQSIIADCAEYVCPRSGRYLNLKKTAEQVIAKINAQIEDPKYHFHFMNTRTAEPDSPYAEQRTSATYYALTRYGIPAFGVETSKNLPTMEMKVQQHNLAINAFMELFGLVPEHPRIYLAPPELKYLVVSINNQIPIAVADGETLFINPQDVVEVIHVEANYDRGLSVDILGLGTINDFRQKYAIDRPTFIVAQKDHLKFGRVKVALRPPGPETPQAPARKAEAFEVKFFVVEVEGQLKLAADGRQIDVVAGDLVKIVDIITEGPRPPEGLTVNFKGFVSDQVKNTGEDRGYLINTAEDLWDKYSLSQEEKIYAVVAELDGRTLAQMTIRIHQPRLDYVVVRRNGGPRLCLQGGETFQVRPGDQVQVLDLKTNVPANRGVQIKAEGKVLPEEHPGAILAFKTLERRPLALVVTRAGVIMGKIVLDSG